MQSNLFVYTISTLLLAAIACDQAVLGHTSNTRSRPNVVVLNLDDADAEILSDANIEAHYPTLSQLAKRSTTFTNAHCTTPFCAPSRAAFFTGKYAFSNGCKIGREGSPTENGFEGGYQRFKTLGHDENELGVWMKRAGYRTIHVGKYHHSGFDHQVPVGWDDFSATLGAKYFGTSKFSNISKPKPRPFRIDSDQYITDIDRNEALLALDRQFEHRTDQPFLLYLAPFAPHTPLGKDVTKMVQPKYANYASHLQQPVDDPDFDEADISDKSKIIRRGPLTKSEKEYLKLVYLCRLRAMKSVDDMFGAIVDRVAAAGQIENTWFIVTSDNGYSLGHHRMIAKKDPYNHSSNIPLIVAGPKHVTDGERNYASHLVAHIDVCPTILDLAGAKIPVDLDGKSFAPLIRRESTAPPRQWRRSIMIENWASKYVANQRVPMAYTAERFYDSIHIGWVSGEHEFYDMQSDPYQLENRFDSLSMANQQELMRSLLSFREESLPTLTMISPTPNKAIVGVIEYRGFMEDNAVAGAALLTIQSKATARYFNGNCWQETPASIRIPPFSNSTSISQWSHTQRIFSETENGFDVFKSTIVPVDSDGNFGSPVTSTNPIGNSSMRAQFHPSIEGKIFTSSRVRLAGSSGNSNDRINVAVTILDENSGKYFNGRTFQIAYATFPAQLDGNRRWQLKLSLPKGSYRGSAYAHRGNQHQRRASMVDFEVQ